MPLVSVLLLSLSIGFLLIGLYDAYTYGFGQAYGFIMLSIVFFFIYTYRKLNAKK